MTMIAGCRLSITQYNVRPFFPNGYAKLKDLEIIHSIK
jgi:hypothetical protein